MENKDYIIEENVLVHIGKYEEAPYRMICYDGYAIGELLDKENHICPNTIHMEYPTLNDILNDKGGIADDILYYRGLYDKTTDDIHYGDIMMFMGEIVDKKID